MKRNLVGKILGKIKIFVQDFVPIRTALLLAVRWGHWLRGKIPSWDSIGFPDGSRLGSTLTIIGRRNGSGSEMQRGNTPFTLFLTAHTFDPIGSGLRCLLQPTPPSPSTRSSSAGMALMESNPAEIGAGPAANACMVDKSFGTPTPI